MKVVKFIRNHQGYNGGETAGFPDDYADMLVKEGVAEKVKAKPGPKPNAVNKRNTKPKQAKVQK